MALKIIGAEDGVLEQMRTAILDAIPGSVVEVRPGGAGHFEISVTSEAFRGQPRVRQHQSVYAAVALFMTGDAPPVHAIDRLETRTP